MTCPCGGELRPRQWSVYDAETGNDSGVAYACGTCGIEWTGEELDEMADTKPSDGAMRAAERILRNLETYNRLGGIRIAVPPVENVAELIDKEMRITPSSLIPGVALSAPGLFSGGAA